MELRVNDFETVREALVKQWGLADGPELQALGRIEAEVERLNATNVALAEELVKEVAEVERLRAERDEAVADRIRVAGERNLAQEARTKDGEHYRAAIERLRALAKEEA